MGERCKHAVTVLGMGSGGRASMHSVTETDKTYGRTDKQL